MNFSNLLNDDEVAPTGFGTIDAQHDASHASTRMSFDYLNSEHNMSPAGTGMGSPAFYSTPSEFVGDSDSESMAYSMNPGSVFDNSFNHPFANPGALLGVPDQLYNPTQPLTGPSQYPQYPQFPTHPPTVPSSDPLLGSSFQAFPPFAFSSDQHGQHTSEYDPGATSFSQDIVTETDDEKPKKGSGQKGKAKGKGKVRIEDSANSDGNSSTGPTKVRNDP